MEWLTQYLFVLSGPGPGLAVCVSRCDSGLVSVMALVYFWAYVQTRNQRNLPNNQRIVSTEAPAPAPARAPAPAPAFGQMCLCELNNFWQIEIQKFAAQLLPTFAFATPLFIYV